MIAHFESSARYFSVAFFGVDEFQSGEVLDENDRGRYRVPIRCDRGGGESVHLVNGKRLDERF